MGAPTRFPGGVTTARVTEALANLVYPDPTKWSFTFLRGVGFADACAATPVGFTTTKVGTGTTTLTDVAGMFGAYTIINSGADDDQVSVQTKYRVAAADSTKKLIFSFKADMSDATQTDILAGLTVSDTTPLGAAASEETGVSDGIFFYKIDGATDWRLVVRSGGTTQNTVTSLGTITASTADELAFTYTPVNKECSIFVNGVKKSTITISTFPANPMVIQLSGRNGDANARTFRWNYVLAAQEI